jgi:hypothetical protein
MMDRCIIWTADQLAALKPLCMRDGGHVVPINSIVIHHTCGGSGETVEGIHAEHLRIGYGGIGYHYVIDHSGRTWRGRPVWARGAHARSNNAGRIGIALMGRYDADAPTDIMVGVCLGLVEQIQALFGPLAILPHSAVPGSNTVCPGAACILALEDAGLQWAVTR